MQKFILAATVTIGASAHALDARVDWRRSMFCGSLLNATTSAREPRLESTFGRSKSPDERTLIDETFRGTRQIKTFKRALAASRTNLIEESATARRLVDFSSARDLLRRASLTRQYTYGAAYAIGLLHLTALNLYIATDLAMNAPARLINFLPIAVALGAVGVYDFSWRWLTSHDRSIVRLTKAIERFERGSDRTLHFETELLVSRRFVNVLGLRRRLGWADLHEENVWDELPGGWRYVKYEGDSNAEPFVLNVNVDGDWRTHELKVSMTARPAPAKWWRLF